MVTFDVSIHVWPVTETHSHLLVGEDCACHPIVDISEGENPVVYHQTVKKKVEWHCGRSQNNIEACFGIPSKCDICDYEVIVYIKNDFGECLPPIAVQELGWIGECDKCGHMTLIPLWAW